MTRSRNRRGGPHHNFFGGGRVGSPDLKAGVPHAAAADVVAALRVSAAAFRALASGPEGFTGVIMANVVLEAALLAACRLISSVRTTKAWRSVSNGPKTAVGRGRQKRSWANFENTRSASVPVYPPLARRRKPSRVRAASSVAAWVR
jgi:hypothetical protein